MVTKKMTKRQREKALSEITRDFCARQDDASLAANKAFAAVQKRLDARVERERDRRNKALEQIG
mgnify:CR=1 FL=1